MIRAMLRILQGLVLDRFGVALSTLCAIHCLAAPLVLLLAPGLLDWWEHPLAHILPAAVILPVAAYALGRGAMRHRNGSVIVLGIAGLGLVSTALVMQGLPGDACAAPGTTGDVPSCCADPGASDGVLFGLSATTLLSAAGGLSLALAHLANIRCCTKHQCVR